MSGEGAEGECGRGLAAALAAAGCVPPVLVIADSQTVGRLALAWLQSFDEAGWLYRVRSFGGRANDAEISALAAEAMSLRAKTIAAIGDATLQAAAKAAVETVDSRPMWFGISLMRIDPWA
ncbi:MAG: hypothetical protein O3A37_12605 [Planctomycetota bacterium]|jgi:hypothetical protein|nr:hypothetical protein [Planctomycetota bacterium]